MFFPIFLAMISGISLAIPVFFQPTKKETPELLSIYVLQTGVFENFQNAQEEQQKYTSSMIYYDEDVYRVLVGASMSLEGLEKIKKTLQNQSISYYEKTLMIKPEETQMFKNYNVMLEKAQSEDAILLLNHKILEKMVET